MLIGLTTVTTLTTTSFFRDDIDDNVVFLWRHWRIFESTTNLRILDFNPPDPPPAAGCGPHLTSCFDLQPRVVGKSGTGPYSLFILSVFSFYTLFILSILSLYPLWINSVSSHYYLFILSVSSLYLFHTLLSLSLLNNSLSSLSILSLLWASVSLRFFTFSLCLCSNIQPCQQCHHNTNQ